MLILRNILQPRMEIIFMAGKTQITKSWCFVHLSMNISLKFSLIFLETLRSEWEFKWVFFCKNTDFYVFPLWGKWAVNITKMLSPFKDGELVCLFSILAERLRSNIRITFMLCFLPSDEGKFNINSSFQLCFWSPPFLSYIAATILVANFVCLPFDDGLVV